MIDYHYIHGHESHTESILIQFSIGNASDGAWCFAEALSALTGPALADAITTMIVLIEKAPYWVKFSTQSPSP